MRRSARAPARLFPDLLLFSQDRGRRLQAVVEVETGESVNHLEALAQWAPLSKLKVDFFLYVPANMVDVARRLCEDNKVEVTEIWSYHLVGDQFRFTLMHRAREAAPAPARRPPEAGAKRRPPQTRPAPGQAQAGAAAPRRPGTRQTRAQDAATEASLGRLCHLTCHSFESSETSAATSTSRSCSRPPAAAARCGSRCCTGSARRRISRSDARPWTTR